MRRNKDRNDGGILLFDVREDNNLLEWPMSGNSQQKLSINCKTATSTKRSFAHMLHGFRV